MADKKNEIAEEMPEESLEELFAKLDQVAKELESGDTSLEESFGLYQKGMEMLEAL
ncbi:MAG: exodeoxyribonuclease VII small subunit [Coprococcus sp.]